MVSQGHWFWYQSKARVQLAIGSISGPILHRFRDQTLKSRKIAIFVHLSCLTRSLEHQQELFANEDMNVIIVLVILVQYHRVTDRQTSRPQLAQRSTY